MSEWVGVCLSVFSEFLVIVCCYCYCKNELNSIIIEMVCFWLKKSYDLFHFGIEYFCLLSECVWIHSYKEVASKMQAMLLYTTHTHAHTRVVHHTGAIEQTKQHDCVSEYWKFIEFKRLWFETKDKWTFFYCIDHLPQCN